MKAEDRIEAAYARRAPIEEVDIRGLKEEADQAIALLRRWHSAKLRDDPLEMMRLREDTEAYLEGGDEG